jgi:hypothetical protein
MTLMQQLEAASTLIVHYLSADGTTPCGVHRRREPVRDDGRGPYRRGCVSATDRPELVTCRACRRVLGRLAPGVVSASTSTRPAES